MRREGVGGRTPWIGNNIMFTDVRRKKYHHIASIFHKERKGPL